MTRFAVSAPAKINLHLQVLGRRQDGFHELRTLLQSIDLADRLIAEETPTGDLSLTVEPAAAVTAGDDNLILQAARALRDAHGVTAGASLRLIKRIPVGGGLGGGSADAAAALVLLDRLWRIGLDGLQLHELAAGLGSDVPFFLRGGLALGVGRGDEVYPLPDMAELAVVVAAPPVAVPTAEVYRRMDARLTWDRQEATVYAFAAGLRGRPEWRVLANDLEETVITGWPEVGEVLRMLRASRPLYAGVSGSGAAGFALFDDVETARQAAAALPAGWRTHVGATLSRRAARLAVGVDE